MWASVLTEQNSWWKHGREFGSFDKDLNSTERAFHTWRRRGIDMQPGKIYLLLGPRQVGKTVWIKQKIKSLLINDVPQRAVCYLSCDTLTSRRKEELRRAIDAFTTGLDDVDCLYLFLDEINYIDEWEIALKWLSDSGRMRRMTVLATGSSPVSLKRRTETLPGRGMSGNEYFLKPMPFREVALQLGPRIAAFAMDEAKKKSFQRLPAEVERNRATLDSLHELANACFALLPFVRELTELFHVYTKTGGFPLVINEYCNSRYCSEQRQGRIEKKTYEDFVRIVLGDLGNLNCEVRIVKQVLDSIVKKIGNRYSYRDLSRCAEGVTQPTLVKYVAELEDSFLLKRLLAYDFKSKRAREKGDKKIYFTDPFIRSAAESWLTGSDPFEGSDQWATDENKVGYLVEAIVAQHLAVAHETPVMRTPDTFLWFFYNRRELDFVYRMADGGYVGVETAYQASPKASDVARVREVDKYVLITRDEFDDFRRDPAVLMVPAAVFLAVLDRSEGNL
jgi:hypothetical protein